MAEGTVFAAGWTLDDVQWSKFDASKVDPGLLQAVKAASLVEFNAPDYVIYLKRVFKDSGAETLANIEQWGVASAKATRRRISSATMRRPCAAAAAAKWSRVAWLSAERRLSTAPSAKPRTSRC
jgi:hypothetical protein